MEFEDEDQRAWYQLGQVWWAVTAAESVTCRGYLRHKTPRDTEIS